MKIWTLSSRITAVMAVIVVIATAASTQLFMTRLNALLIESTSLELERETEIQAGNFVASVGEAMRDIRVLAGVPPIQGIIRAGRNAGIDPLDGSTFEIWRQRLEVIFAQMASNKPEYLQIRFIGAVNEGQELVRVHRSHVQRPIEIVPVQDMQSKGSRDYFLATIQLPRDHLYFSDINLNREYGEIQEPHIPVLRVATPVYDESETVFGIVILNLAMGPMLERIADVVNADHEYFVTNEEGQFLLHPEPGRAFRFEYAAAPTLEQELPGLPELDGASTTATRLLRRAERVLSMRRVEYGPPELGRWLTIVVRDHFDAITRVSQTVIRQVVFLMGALVLGAVAVGYWMSRQIVRPVENLTQSVRKMDLRLSRLDLPATLDGEAKELADALGATFEALRRRTEELESNNKELEQFAYIASHDLQEPLRTIRSFAGLLHGQYSDALDEKAKKSLDFILDSSERMQALVHGLLEYSRIGAKAQPERTNLNALLRDVLDDLQAAIDNKQAEVRVGPLPSLSILPIEVRLLFQNLIGNAIKFTRPDVKPRIEISAERDGSVWRFAVADNGVGIAPEQREKVFLIFQRLQNRQDYEGTGIGLAHCRKIVELHHGKIWIEDAPGGGTLFRFTLRELT